LQQLYFNFPIKPTYLAEDFIVSSANIKAFSYLEIWPAWSCESFPRIFIIYGELGSGKTHLSYIWQKHSQAKFLQEQDCYSLNLQLQEKAFILEDIENIDEELLLHLINFTHENKQFLLLTSQFSPKEMIVELPDLRSRLLAINSIAIEKPTEDLLKIVMLKAMTERQMKISEKTIDFVIARINRSFGELNGLIEEIDRISKVDKRAITIPLIKKILDKSTQN
jgi:chromosomal replication initiation ATPase DnaA